MLQDVSVRTIDCVVIVHRKCCSDVCVRTIGVLLSFIDNAAGCLCQKDRCVVIVHRQCCSMFVSER